jgi:hypothetical protein
MSAVLWCRRSSVLLVCRRENNFIRIQVVAMSRMPEAMSGAPSQLA